MHFTFTFSLFKNRGSKEDVHPALGEGVEEGAQNKERDEEAALDNATQEPTMASSQKGRDGKHQSSVPVVLTK